MYMYRYLNVLEAPAQKCTCRMITCFYLLLGDFESFFEQALGAMVSPQLGSTSSPGADLNDIQSPRSSDQGKLRIMAGGQLTTTSTSFLMCLDSVRWPRSRDSTKLGLVQIDQDQT